MLLGCTPQKPQLCMSGEMTIEKGDSRTVRDKQVERINFLLTPNPSNALAGLTESVKEEFRRGYVDGWQTKLSLDYIDANVDAPRMHFFLNFVSSGSKFYDLGFMKGAEDADESA